MGNPCGDAAGRMSVISVGPGERFPYTPPEKVPGDPPLYGACPAGSSTEARDVAVTLRHPCLRVSRLLELAAPVGRAIRQPSSRRCQIALIWTTAQPTPRGLVPAPNDGLGVRRVAPR